MAGTTTAVSKQRLTKKTRTVNAPPGKPVISTKSVASVILGIMSLGFGGAGALAGAGFAVTIVFALCAPPVCAVTGLLGFILALVGFVQGNRGKRECAKHPGKFRGAALGTFGLVLGIFGMAFNAIMIIIGVAVLLWELFVISLI